MRRVLPLLGLCLLATCATFAPSADRRSDVTRLDDPVAVGRIGPGGGPLMADRGIGGTGGPLTMSATMQLADRGIGGTGIVGVVTGFGSIFVDGLEIQYNNAAAVDIDGAPSSVAALRVGQLVAIRADGPATTPNATAISIRNEVIGRIEAANRRSHTLTIAGQAVSMAPGTWGASRFAPGDWVKVSGLRRPDGTVLASRLDSAPAGKLTVRGRVVLDGATMRVGSLVLEGSAANIVQDGQFVIVSGDYAAGRSHVIAVAPDTLSASPAAYFGDSTNRLLIQAYVRREKGALSMNGATVPAVVALPGTAGSEGLAIVSLQRGPDGSYAVSDLRYAGYRGQPGQGSHSVGRTVQGDTSAHGGRRPSGFGRSVPGGNGATVPAAEHPLKVTAPGQ